MYLTFDDPYDIWLTNVKEKTIARLAHVFMTLIWTNFSQ